MKRIGRGMVLIGVLCWAAACAPARRAAVAPPGPPPVDWRARIAEADGLYAKGCYTALKAARDTYEEALAVPEHRASVVDKFVHAAIAVELREKEIGVLSTKPVRALSDLVASEPALSAYAPWLELLDGLPVKVKGNAGLEQAGSRTLEAHLDWVNTRVQTLDGEIAEQAPTDDLAAALRLALRAAFFYKFPDKLDLKTIQEAHPGSRMVAFQAAVSPSLEIGMVEALLAVEPEFAEAHYYVGEVALLGGKLLTAERHYLAANEKIPESLSVLISLAKVAFQMEELETCLEYNEKALAFLPTYRDALLGKGLCLGYLGREEEALTVLGRLLELGTYYLGEGNYWTAWNLNELQRLEEARKAIDAAKVFLVNYSDVLALSGIIAYRQGRLDDAEKDLRQALNIEPSNSDAAMYLGRLYADRKDWLNSGIYFAGAALSLEEKERGMEKKIEEIEAADMPQERKNRLVIKKKVQILSTQATKATCQYNGAAGYHNAGSFGRALDLARLAAAHPAFAEKAAELIKLIQDR
jgi:tetratricopeptide (TPR) repeat protein